MRIRWFALLMFLGSCGPTGEPTLDVLLTPTHVSGPDVVIVKVTATQGDGKVGTGNVTISSSAGSLVNKVTVPLDSFGGARVELICDPTVESACASSVRVLAEWTVGKVVVTGEASPRLNASGSSGTGGGTTTGTGEDGGLTILRNACSGPSSSGAEVSCCYSEAVMTAPTCGWAKVTQGATFAIPFTLVDGGMPNTLAYLNYTVPSVITSAADCTPSMGLFLQPTGLTGALLMTCYRFEVLADRSWALVTNTAANCGEQTSSDTLGNNYLLSDCQDTTAAATDRGSIRLVTGATLQNGAGSWVQSDDSVFVLALRKR